MAQADYIVSNGTGAAVRSDLNGQLAAIVSNNSGATAPATTYAYQWWADTTTNTLKLRNSANSAWIELRQLDGDFTTVSVDNGTAAAPSIYFNASGTDTGIFSSGTDAVDIATAGTRRFGIASGGDITVYGGNVTLNEQGDLRFADSDSSNFIALQAPATISSNVTLTLPSADGSNGQVLTTNGSGTLSFTTPAATSDKITEGNTEAEVIDTGSDGHFKVTTEGTERFRCDASGRLLVGTSTANGGALLQVNGGYNILKGFNRRPPLHRGPLFTKTTATTLSVVADCSLNGFFYSAATAVTMGTHTNNTDMAIWQHPTSGALVSDASFTTAPAGATGGSIVAGYHYIPSGRPTAVNSGSPTASAEILEYSIWDLTWRPECPDPRGMANIDGRFWCDLYLCGSTSFAGTTFSAVQSSKIGLTIADNSSPPLIPSFYGGNGSTAYSLTGGNNPGSWYNFFEVAHSFGKRLMFSWEFQAAAFGAPEAGSRGSDPGTVQWERQSKWGLAQATGTLNIWGIERVGIYTSGSNTNTGGRGTEYADAPRAVLLGGAWADGANSGSRSANWGHVPSLGNNDRSARFAAGHLVLG